MALALFWIFGNGALGNYFLKNWEIAPIPYDEVDRNYQYGVVLTGILQNEGEPTDRPHFQKGADRLFHTFQLYERGLIKKILISGGAGSLRDVSFREAINLKKVYLEMGVPEEDLITEIESNNTVQSAVNVTEILRQNKASNDFLLITSAFHMRRARACFEKVLQQPVRGFPVDLYTDSVLTFESYIIPTLGGVIKWERLFMELTGYTMYRLAGYI